MCPNFNSQQIFIQLVSLVKNLVAADRNGDWELHVQTVESLIPVFREFDCINYLRYGSWYLENVKKMEIENPYLYRKFIQGYFVIRDKEGKFNTVSPDMKLEQTIQRSQKSSKGILGQTRKSTYVAEWELVYHEILMICNAFRNITNSNVMAHSEAVIHHDLSGNRSEHFHENVTRLLQFMNQHGNPYDINEPVRLHNFITKQYVNEYTKDRLLNIRKHGLEQYNQFKQERFILKQKKLSELISKVKLPSFDHQTLSQPVTVKLITKKELSQAHRDMEIAKERGESIKNILSYDLLPTNTLFAGDSPTKPVKHTLIAQIEKNLSPEHFKFNENSPLQTTVVVDFMSQVRMIKMSSLKTFGEVVSTVLQRSTSVCSLQELHIVFDSYLPLSVKECERIRRESTNGTIDLAVIKSNTPIPVQIEKFWSSTANKTNLQMLARQKMEQDSANATISTIASGAVVNNELHPSLLFSRGGGEKQPLHELSNTLEEADLRIVPHVDWAVKHGAKRIVVLSKLTDVIILLLRFVATWLSQGMCELWVRFGTGTKRRFIPLHILLDKLSPLMSKVLIKVHILTGDDEMSKIGTKLGEINAEPTKFLTQFGETCDQYDYDEVEKYLVRVWKPNTKCESFDELRYSEYKRSIPLSELPPTSHSIRGHILRAFYLVRRCICLLDNVYPKMEPCNFGWQNVDDVLRPSKFLKFLPEDILLVCRCKICVHAEIALVNAHLSVNAMTQNAKTNSHIT